MGREQKAAAQQTEKALLPETGTVSKDGLGFCRHAPLLASCPAFADGRASWIALFQSLEDGNGAAMTGALDQLEEVMKH